MSFRYYNWEEVEINWELVNLNWEEVGILIDDVLPSVGVVHGKPKYDLKKLNKLSKEKKRKIIKIACKIEGKEYVESKYINKDDIEISVKDVDTILNKILNNVKVNVQNIS